ncbi:hypothetical protein SAMN04489733_1254 [Amycolatopsis keratiniphila]|nr:hypothetical protein SAMN04489733_1254 [Amycolatopsis keratiniphila]
MDSTCPFGPNDTFLSLYLSKNFCSATTNAVTAPPDPTPTVTICIKLEVFVTCVGRDTRSP